MLCLPQRIRSRIQPTSGYSAFTTHPRLALANEKRRKRRESHNAVERRRRDNINEKIQELAMLLPDEWLSDGAKAGSIAGMLSGTVSGSIGGEEETKEVKANKGVILRNSVEYIKCVSLSAIASLPGYVLTPSCPLGDLGISFNWSRPNAPAINSSSPNLLTIGTASGALRTAFPRPMEAASVISTDWAAWLVPETV